MSTENPVVVVAAFTESMRVMLGEIRTLAAEAFKFQLQMMELIPEADRITAFKAVLDAHQQEVASDERVAVAVLATVEQLGGHAVQLLPAVLAARQERAAAAASTAAERDALEKMRQANELAAERRRQEAAAEKAERAAAERHAEFTAKLKNGRGGIE